MGLLERLGSWWRRRGSGDGADTDASGPAGADEGAAGAASAATHECAVCGTGVDAGASECPLCRSTDLVPAGAAFEASEPEVVDAGQRVAGDDGAVDRLRELRAEGELLQRYDDHWEAVDGDFRVETATGTRQVDSRAELVALLRAQDS